MHEDTGDHGDRDGHDRGDRDQDRMGREDMMRDLMTRERRDRGGGPG
ncbi:MAG: hypothetical protein WAU68_08765 [Vitreimonas sp.]